jgi:hypothetical protein
MQLNRAPELGSGALTDFGHMIGKTLRSGVGILKGIRGDSGNAVVEGAATTNYANMAVYGTLAAIALFILVKPARAR